MQLKASFPFLPHRTAGSAVPRPDIIRYTHTCMHPVVPCSSLQLLASARSGCNIGFQTAQTRPTATTRVHMYETTLRKATTERISILTGKRFVFPLLHQLIKLNRLREGCQAVLSAVAPILGRLRERKCDVRFLPGNNLCASLPWVIDCTACYSKAKLRL